MKKLKKAIRVTIIEIIVIIIYFLIVTNLKENIIIHSNIKLYKAFIAGGITGCIVIAIKAIIILIYAFMLLKSKSEDKAERRRAQKQIKSDPIKRFVTNAKTYLEENKSSDVFADSLNFIIATLPQIEDKIKTLESALLERFGENTLSYNNLFASIKELFTNLTKNADDLLNKAKIYDKTKNINFNEARRSNAFISEHNKNLEHYRKYAEDITNVYEQAITRLDKLIIEASKLNDDDLNKSIEKIKRLDETASNIKFYGKSN